ncbi:hypothetical protein BJV82DRAFT_675513 [Fennellomyces sp. T-0311]|nr:hypothetical protein BJV82DRAFT_675513 [Fennellomyces sp. T-0311]
MSYDASTNNDNILDEIAEVQKTFPKEDDDWLVNSNAAKKLNEFEEMMADLRRYLVIEALKENSDDEYVLASYYRGYYRGESALQEVEPESKSSFCFAAGQLRFQTQLLHPIEEDEDDDDTLPPSDLEDERPAKRQRSTD